MCEKRREHREEGGATTTYKVNLARRS